MNHTAKRAIASLLAASLMLSGQTMVSAAEQNGAQEIAANKTTTFEQLQLIEQNIEKEELPYQVVYDNLVEQYQLQDYNLISPLEGATSSAITDGTTIDGTTTDGTMGGNDVPQPVKDDGILVIALDAGHGGSDPGARHYGLDEKNLNLSIARYTQAFLQEYADVEIFLTRSDDTYVTLEDRVRLAAAAGADVFVSLHNNASENESTRGSMVFYPNASLRSDLHEEGKGLASSILRELTALGLKDLGVRTRDSQTGSTYADGNLSDYYGVIRHAKLNGIAGIIVEHAFMTNYEESIDFLSEEEYLMELAEADAAGIADYYDLVPSEVYIPDTTLAALNEKQLYVEWDVIDGAKGYIVYRSEKRNGTYERIAKVPGRYNTEFTDNVATGKKYFYKVQSYRKIGTKNMFSELSYPVRGITIGGSEFTLLKQKVNGSVELSWKSVAGSDGYEIRRSYSKSGGYKTIAYLDDESYTSYMDDTVEPGETYYYRVRARNDLYGNVGYGKNSTPQLMNFLPDPDFEYIEPTDNGSLALEWVETEGASKVVLQRSENPYDGFKTIATFTGDDVYSYEDTTAEIGKTYYYQVNAYNQSGIVRGATGWMESDGVQNFQIPTLKKCEISDTDPGINLRWTAVAGADGYIVLRDDGEGSFNRVGYVKSGTVTEYFDEIETEIGQTYNYKIKAYKQYASGKLMSESSNEKSVMAGTPIMGESDSSVAQMAAYYNFRGYPYPAEVYSNFGAPTIEDFAQIVYEEATVEGVRPEIVFAQMCKETGFLQFGGDVLPEQCNFAGIGAVGGGAKGHTFTDVREGIRAQVQHLKAYASYEPLVQACVDPRFQYVTRGTAIYTEWLGKHENPGGYGWATGYNYGYSLRDDYLKQLLQF